MEVKTKHFQWLSAMGNVASTLYPRLRGFFTCLWKLRRGVKLALQSALGISDQQVELGDVERAKRLGFPICPCAFPPGIMTLKDDTFTCPKCERTRHRPLTAGERNAAARERWERGDTWVQGGRGRGMPRTSARW